MRSILSLMPSFKERFRDVVASVYLHNEYTGWQGLERLLEAIRLKMPLEQDFIAVVEKHAADERKHYFLFRKYFQNLGTMPLKVDSAYGYVEQVIGILFRRSLDSLDPATVLDDDRQFFRLCRLIMMTEFRGMKQVAALLANPMILEHPELERIYRVIERDEPSHCIPYQQWLAARGGHQPGILERLADFWVHHSLVALKIPILFFNPRMPRLREFPV